LTINISDKPESAFPRHGDFDVHFPCFTGGKAFLSCRGSDVAIRYGKCTRARAHGRCVSGPTYDLLMTLSKFLNLGLTLKEVVLRATANPAKIIGGSQGLGALRVGGVADVAVLEIQKGEFEFTDTHRWILKGNQKIVATNTITRGKIMGEMVKTRYPPYQGKPSGIPTYKYDSLRS
jgi:dihydroorotase